MLRAVWKTLQESVDIFYAASGPTRGAAISFYAVTAFVPVLVIAIAIAGFFFGEEAARGRIVYELRGLIGEDGAGLLESAIQSASKLSEGTFATLVSIAGFVVISSGVFLELRDGLNDIWKVQPRGETLSRFIRARAASFGLVVAMGFLLLISLVTDAAITFFTDALNARLPFGAAILRGLNFFVSFAIIAAVFAAIYRILPAKNLTFRNVALASIVTAALFQVGKVLIATYLGSGSVGSSYGVAGALIALLFWVYYSAQIFLFGAALSHVLLRERPDLTGREIPTREEQVPYAPN
jgi:membrane protein